MAGFGIPVTMTEISAKHHPTATLGGKKILIFSDGTGQYGGIRPDQSLSNIYKMYRSMRPGFTSDIDPSEQVAFYDPGLGSGDGGGRFRNILSAAFGTGISENIVDCYEAILKHYRPDDEVYLFGFSRGAYTARCVANVLNLCGVPSRDGEGNLLPSSGPGLRSIAEEAVYKVYEHGSGRDRAEFELEREELARRFRKKYDSAGVGLDGEEQGNVAPTFIGVFDTVAALGGLVVRRVLMALATLAIVLATWGWLSDWGLAGKILSTLPAALFAWFAFWATLRQFKYIVDPPQGGMFSWHFASWNLKNYDRFLDNMVGYARHALSIDENRKRFPFVGWGHSDDVDRVDRGELAWLKPMWFSGNHSDIGGSYPESESRLSDIALRWMVEELLSTPNPPIVNATLLRTYPDHTALQHDEVQSSRDTWLPSWLPFRLGWKSRQREIHPEALLHRTVLDRFAEGTVEQYGKRAKYRPPSLAAHEDVKHHYD